MTLSEFGLFLLNEYIDRLRYLYPSVHKSLSTYERFEIENSSVGGYINLWFKHENIPDIRARFNIAVHVKNLKYGIGAILFIDRSRSATIEYFSYGEIIPEEIIDPEAFYDQNVRFVDVDLI